MFCHQCSNKVVENTKFCTNCGAELARQDSESNLVKTKNHKYSPTIPENTSNLPRSASVNVSINFDDGKNKVDKVIDEFAESERLRQGVNKLKNGIVTTIKFSILFIVVSLLLLIILVALGIVS
jgi:hypothetical protein